MASRAAGLAPRRTVEAIAAMWSLPLVAALAAAASAAPAPIRLPQRELPAPLGRAVERAEQAIRHAACEVERRFGEGDPDASAARCEESGPVEGVRVGRTSARLRNPNNAPPGWARAYLAQTDGQPASSVAAVAFDLGDRVGVLRPIELRQRCLRCHDARESLAPGIREWLSRAYPRDAAVGYRLGDLRGFWWAEGPTVPPGPR
jgi:hypothetical protein